MGYVVTGGGRGIGRAVTEKLAATGETVVVIEFAEAALSWVDGSRIVPILGDAADPTVAGRAVAAAGTLRGWVSPPPTSSARSDWCSRSAGWAGWPRSPT